VLVRQEDLVRRHVRHVFGFLSGDSGRLDQMRDMGRHRGLLLHLGDHEPLLRSHLDMLSKRLLLQVSLGRLMTLIILFGEFGDLGGSRTQRGLVAGA